MIYYIDAQNGNDLFSGESPLYPWRTVARVNKNKIVAPGTTFLFKRGCVWREELTVNWSGEEGAPITIGAYGSGSKPVFNGADLVSAWQYVTPGNYKAVLLKQPGLVFVNDALLDKAHWEWIAGVLYLVGVGDPNLLTIEATQRTRGVGAWYKQWVVVTGVSVEKTSASNGWGAGIIAYAGSSHISINDCAARQSGHSGIYLLKSNNCTVANCESFDNEYTGIYAVDGAHNTTIMGCRAHHNKYKGIDIELNSGDSTVANCVAHDNLREGLDMDAVTNVRFARCLVYGNGYGVNGNGISVTRKANNVVFDACSVFGNALYGIEVESGQGTLIDGCRFWDNGKYNVALKDSNTTIRGCAFMPCPTGQHIAIYAGSEYNTLDWNAYLDPRGFCCSYNGKVYKSFAEWKAVTKQDAHSVAGEKETT